jgi:hypothetical protein
MVRRRITVHCGIAHVLETTCANAGEDATEYHVKLIEAAYANTRCRRGGRRANCLAGSP